jgi:1-aminocyclopropane-1-carboxylate deaminase/D-cysteine desulfhydrase-like pyridoxal-dependent ACC family enzyme
VNAQPQLIHRRDLENKMRELQGGVSDTREAATNTLVTVGAIVAVGVIAVAFMLGRRKGKKRMTVVEVRRI